jgi:hypothetical protein
MGEVKIDAGHLLEAGQIGKIKDHGKENDGQEAAISGRYSRTI